MFSFLNRSVSLEEIKSLLSEDSLTDIFTELKEERNQGTYFRLAYDADTCDTLSLSNFYNDFSSQFKELRRDDAFNFVGLKEFSKRLKRIEKMIEPSISLLVYKKGLELKRKVLKVDKENLNEAKHLFFDFFDYHIPRVYGIVNQFMKRDSFYDNGFDFLFKDGEERQLYYDTFLNPVMSTNDVIMLAIVNYGKPKIGAEELNKLATLFYEVKLYNKHEIFEDPSYRYFLVKEVNEMFKAGVKKDEIA